MQVILEGTRVKKADVAAFVELHIEQGPLLEKGDVQLGIVSAIAAPAALRVFLSGDGGHAGALLMPDRQVPILFWHGCATAFIGMQVSQTMASPLRCLTLLCL